MTSIPDIRWDDQPELARPVFISYSTDDFRVAYAVFKRISKREDSLPDGDLPRQVLFDMPPLGHLPSDLEGQLEDMSDLTGQRSGSSAPLKLPGIADWMGWMSLPLGKATTLLVIWTPNAMDAPGVGEEIEQFLRLSKSKKAQECLLSKSAEKTVVFACINGTPPPSELLALPNVNVQSVTAILDPVLEHLEGEIDRIVKSSNWSDAWHLLTDLLILYRLNGSPVEKTIWALNFRGSVEMAMGAHYLAADTFQVALSLIGDDPREQAKTLTNVASVYYSWLGLTTSVSRRNWQRANDYAVQALRILRCRSDASGGLDPDSQGCMQFCQEMSETMQARIASFDSHDDDEEAMLARAVLADDLGRLAELLSTGHSPNTVDQRGDPVLCLAAHAGFDRVVGALLDNGADIEKPSRSGHAPWHFALDNGDGKTAALLVKRGSNIEKPSATGTPLEQAVATNRRELVKLLLAEGADLTGRHSKGARLPLLFAAYCGATEVCKILIDHGADINAKDVEGRSALLMATAQEQKQILDMLLAGGADVDATDNEGRSAVFLAASNGDAECLGTLIHAGGNANLPNRAGATPIEAARARKHGHIVDMLLKKTRTH